MLEEETLGGPGKDGFNPSTEGLIHETRLHHRPCFALSKSIPQGTNVGPENADLFHQPSGQGTQSEPPRGVRARKGIAFEKTIPFPAPNTTPNATSFTEDSAGLIGTGLAFLGILLGRLLNNQYLDPASSILVEMLLAAVACAPRT